jgi:putative two-component system response regulator
MGAKDNKPLIVIVDDNPANLKIGKNILAERYATATAPSAEKLFNILENNHPAMILLDIDMPEMNGYEAIKVLKSKSETADIPVIFLTARTELDDEITGFSMGAIDYITKPFQPLILLKRIEVQLLIATQQKSLEEYATKLEQMVKEKTQDIYDLQNALLKTIAELVECRDGITGAHIERTQWMIIIILEEIEKQGLYQEETKNWDKTILRHSSQLHDVGKISINDNILRKTQALSKDEFEEIKKHTTIGKQIIEKIESLTKKSEFLNFAKILTVSHHEKWDGSGYPNGLKGDEIPLLGRIMAIADVYDALISVRPYKEALTHEKACKIIENSAGIHFDPVLIDIFRNVKDKFDMIVKKVGN